MTSVNSFPSPCRRSSRNTERSLRLLARHRMPSAISRFAFIGHAAFRSALHILDVLIKRAAGDFVRRRFPGGAAVGEFIGGKLYVEAVGGGVDDDFVAIFHQRDAAAFLRLGRDVADDEA